LPQATSCATLSEANRVARLTRCKQLLKKYDFIWFTDEKVFAIEPPFTSQNDRVYMPVGTKKRFIQPSRLLRTRSTFSKSVMVSVSVSKMVVTELMFVDPGVINIITIYSFIKNSTISEYKMHTRTGQKGTKCSNNCPNA